ncbi:MAG: metallophosphoesterase family protein [Bowdeniella nasicola]|nr:metallophosphoesterase family protein [Bowdeniella nasicola]
MTLVVLTLTSLSIGTLTARVHTPIGPHESVIATTLSDEVHVSLGPLGSVILDSPLPGPFGLAIEVREVPVADPTRELSEQLGAHLSAYFQLAENPAAALAGPRSALITDILGRSAIIFGFGLMAITVGRLATGGHLRATVWRVLTIRGVAPLAVAGTAGALALTIVPLIQAPTGGGRTISALADTPFRDVRVVGQLGPLLDFGASSAVAQYHRTTDFYADVIDNARRVLSAGPSHAAYEELQSDGTRGAVVEVRGEGIVTALHVSDLHCNIALAEAIAEIANASGADLIINTGDTATSGTAAERFCVDVFAKAWADIPVVVADGNHDSVLTAEYERAAGWHVLAGNPLTVAGLTLLGDTDPTLTVIGQGTHLERDESKRELGSRIGAAACESQVDVVALHDPYTARAPENTGCAPLWISGHMHRRIGPELFVGDDGAQVRYTNASTGRGLKENTVIGPMQSDAEMTLLRFGTTRHHPIDMQVIAIHRDASVSVESRLVFSHLAPARPISARDTLGGATQDPGEGGQEDER